VGTKGLLEDQITDLDLIRAPLVEEFRAGLVGPYLIVGMDVLAEENMEIMEWLIGLESEDPARAGEQCPTQVVVSTSNDPNPPIS
jgi:hypothetical protein